MIKKALNILLFFLLIQNAYSQDLSLKENETSKDILDENLQDDSKSQNIKDIDKDNQSPIPLDNQQTQNTLNSNISINIFSNKTQNVLWNNEKNLKVVIGEKFSFKVSNQNIAIFCNFVLYQKQDTYYLISNTKIMKKSHQGMSQKFNVAVNPITLGEKLAMFPLGKGRENDVVLEIVFQK